MLPSDPPPLPSPAPPQSARSGLSILLSLVFLLFLGTAAVSFADDSLRLFLQRPLLAGASNTLITLMLLTGLLGYAAMAFVPAIPKRFFLPISLFLPVASIAILPLLVYFHAHAMWIAWGMSLVQLLLGLFILWRVQAGLKLRWPLFPASQIPDRKFSWLNLAAVILAGGFVILPALLLYTAYSAHLAVDHFTDGFVALRPAGISMQVRQYVRDDGRKVMLVPMSHIGEPKFYHDIAASFPPDSVVLMEGVTDNSKLLTVHIDYSRMAAATGGVQQVTTFRPKGELVPADVDMSTFSPATLELLKSAMLFHAKGLTPETIAALSKPTPPGIEKQLIEDLLTKRNHHLLEVLRARLQNSNTIIVPWGAAHMPEIAREIQKSGFRMVESREFLAIRFGS